MHLVYMCVCVCAAVLHVCVSLVSAAVQECRSESMIANTHHILNQTNPSSLLSCLESLTPHYKYLCFPPKFVFLVFFFFFSSPDARKCLQHLLMWLFILYFCSDRTIAVGEY